MCAPLPEKKKELRRIYQSIDYPFAPELFFLSEYQQADSVFCFVSLPWEIDTWPLLRSVLASGKRLSVPLCLPGRIMQARIVTDLSRLRPGVFGIYEPPEDAPEERFPALTVVPGLAFDLYGYRLGRGGGYYDRWLAGRSGITVGVAREKAIAGRLPADANDVPVRLLLTEKSLYRFSS